MSLISCSQQGHGHRGSQSALGCLRKVSSKLPIVTSARKSYGQQHRSIQFSCVRNVASSNVLLFIFISMIPLWTIPMAAITGNTLILKPSERDPGAAMIIAELCERSGNMTPIRLSSACSCVRRSASWCCQCGAWNYSHRQHHL